MVLDSLLPLVNGIKSVMLTGIYNEGYFSWTFAQQCIRTVVFQTRILYLSSFLQAPCKPATDFLLEWLTSNADDINIPKQLFIYQSSGIFRSLKRAILKVIYFFLINYFYQDFFYANVASTFNIYLMDYLSLENIDDFNGKKTEKFWNVITGELMVIRYYSSGI